MRTPRSTYRLQLHERFGFRDVANVAPYLRSLGVSELYLSPIFKAAPGSTHGYDVLDHQTLNPELGGEAAFRELVDVAAGNGLGLTVDFVPNHMGVGCNGNRYWEDVLRYGRASEFATYFDIDWHSPKTTLDGKLLLPILADQYGVCLESGMVRLAWVHDSFQFEISERKLPLNPKSLARLLSYLAPRLEPGLGPTALELRSVVAALQTLEELGPNDEKAAYRQAVEELDARVAKVIGSDDVSNALTAALDILNGSAGSPETFDLLDELLREQVYRLSASQLALEAINYRRFFAVNELAGIRVELPAVFETVHSRILKLVHDGSITGVRLDHIDGLYDPIGYLEQLCESLRDATGERADELPVHLTVEKILAPKEVLPKELITHGTTGYEFIRLLTGVFVDRRAESSLTSLYRRFTDDRLSFDEHLLQAKRDVLDTLLASDITMLSHELERLADSDRRSRDLTWRSLHSALREVLAAFPAYRSYVRPNGTSTPQDRALINTAVVDAIRRNPAVGRGAYQFIRGLLLGDADLAGFTHFAMRFQQATGPVTAKSLEDTAFYRYTRFVGENEVGGRPDRMGIELDEFHSENAARARNFPLSLIASSTHDTKRGEDVRARLSMLSELPNTWRRVTLTLHRRSESLLSSLDGANAPSRCDEYLYYQTLVGAVPFGARDVDFAALEERLQAYMLKACREAKVNTSWLYPNEDYERAMRMFVSGTLADADFVSTVRRFCARIEAHAACKALGQVALKLCSPGVPDTYQGSELWNQALVDPDNRRPVDFDSMASALAAIDSNPARRRELTDALLTNFADGSVKLFVVSKLLRLRNERPELFATGYAALDAGPSCIAFARGDARASLICAVPRFPFRVTRGRTSWPLGDVWGNQQLVGLGLAGNYRDALTGVSHWIAESAVLGKLFADFPVAILVRQD